MIKKLFLALVGLSIGVSLGYVTFTYLSTSGINKQFSFISPLGIFKPRNQVIGFLPYWLLDSAKSNYPDFITTLTYFGLRVNTDGSILTLSTPTESEPGWYALKSGKLDIFFSTAKKHNVILSLLIASGDQAAIDSLISDPVVHGEILTRQILPIMKKYGFTDLNLDIESVQDASDEARAHFMQFAKTVKRGLDDAHAGTLTLEISPADLLHKRLIDPRRLSPIVDYTVLMAYDYHYIGSRVTGPVAPLYGAGKTLEYDTNTATQKALLAISANKLILGIPLYGYEWETISKQAQSAVIPGTGLTASNARIATLLSECASCSSSFNATTKETEVKYFDPQTETYHQVAYPDKQAMRAKITFATEKKLAGVALWALGYEDTAVLLPLKDYLTQ